MKIYLFFVNRSVREMTVTGLYLNVLYIVFYSIECIFFKCIKRNVPVVLSLENPSPIVKSHMKLYHTLRTY